MTESVAVVLDVEMKSPIDRVWQAITDSKTLSEWMLFKTNNFAPEKGHTFQFSDAPGFPGVIDCTVTEVNPPHRLAYTWKTEGTDGPPHETLVSFTLSEANGATAVHLEQSGFRPDAKQEIGGARYGWKMMLDDLATIVTAPANA